MNKKKGNFFEEHIEKIVWTVVGLVCIGLLIVRVIISPNSVRYDNRQLSAGNIDVYISEQTKLLESKLDRKPELKEAYKQQLGDFVALLNHAINGIDTNIWLPQPNEINLTASKKVYRLPVVGEINGISVEHIRTVAYLPTGTVDEETGYDAVEHEPNDLDFVTVEAKLDLGRLYENFYKNFAGEGVQESWRDPSLAQPVLAAVELQRQEQLADGLWSGWQTVPRTKIESRRRMFEFPEDVDKLPTSGLKIQMLQFNDKKVTKDLLQPLPYAIASASEEWFPPSLHKKFLEDRKTIKAKERREIKAEVKKERERKREAERSQKMTEKTQLTKPTETEGGETEGVTPVTPTLRKPFAKKGVGEPRVGEKERPQKGKEKEVSKTPVDFYAELEKILITDKFDLSQKREPLLFWAHDDTVEPRKSYRYRIRLGVFNPIAGTNQVSEQDKSLRNKVVLWSNFSDTSEVVTIPGTLYFFPREAQEAAGSVLVQVSKYKLGYWYSKDFLVKQGEVIGDIVRNEPGANEKQGVLVPKTINYSTGVALVDVVPVNDWSGGKGLSLSSRHYFDMLYTCDGTNIKRMPIKQRYWAEELQARFNDIRRSEKELKEPLRDWGAKATQMIGPSEGGEGG